MRRIFSIVLLATGVALGAMVGCKGANESTGGGIAAPSATPSGASALHADTAAASPSSAADDCLTLCKAFTKKRAECVDLFTKDLTLTPDQRAKVTAGHLAAADGHECPSQCGFMASKLIPNGKCAAQTTCADFVACYKRANE